MNMSFDDKILLFSPHGKTSKVMNVPHSITNWVLQAVSVSENSPMCVAPASNFIAFKKVFIQLDLPYSAIRMEQIEVRATIFNYATRRKRVMHLLFSLILHVILYKVTSQI